MLPGGTHHDENLLSNPPPFCHAGGIFSSKTDTPMLGKTPPE